MIPCSSISNNTAAYYVDTASNPSSPSHFTKDIPSNVSQVGSQSTLTEVLYYTLKSTPKNPRRSVYIIGMD
jgi:hypothetical protein